jgi:FKBP-type peptidyl-prolyl cis-trans isomerase
MKLVRFLPCALSVGLLLSSCQKTIDSTADNSLADNITAIKTYITTKNVTNVTETASGLNYKFITQNATGAKPVIGEELTIHYKLFRITDGFVIDSSDRTKGKEAPISFAYTGKTVLSGMEEAFAFMKKGERILLLMPNTLAYGPQTSSIIPAYSAIGVDMEIVNIKNEDQQISDYITKKKASVADSVLKKYTFETTASGVRIIKTLTNTKAMVVNGATVKVKYAGKLLNDTQFDAGTLSIVLGSGSTIKGFEEGISKMRLGEKATIVFPSAIGYGTNGSGSTIPPYAPLVFDIEIVE